MKWGSRRKWAKLSPSFDIHIYLFYISKDISKDLQGHPPREDMGGKGPRTSYTDDRNHQIRGHAHDRIRDVDYGWWNQQPYWLPRAWQDSQWGEACDHTPHDVAGDRNPRGKAGAGLRRGRLLRRP